jgi:RNA polymerase sigma factor (sigma-70 family)
MFENENQPLERWSDEELLRSANEGNTRAFEIFCTRALPRLLEYLKQRCRRIGAPESLAEDLAQDTMLRALKQLADRDRGAIDNSFKLTASWLLTIGYNLLLDWKRRDRVRIMPPADLPEPEALPVVHDAEQREEVLKFLNWLPERDRELLELIYLKGMKPTEAGAELGLSESASYKAHQRALENLRDMITEHGMITQGKVS